MSSIATGSWTAICVQAFTFDQPTANEANRNHQAQGVEKANRPAHLDNGVQLGDRSHDKQQKQDHLATLVSK